MNATVVLPQGMAGLLVGRNYALALAVITPLALLMGRLAAPLSAIELIADRGVETVVGVVGVVGVVVGVLVATGSRRRVQSR